MHLEANTVTMLHGTDYKHCFDWCTRLKHAKAFLCPFCLEAEAVPSLRRTTVMLDETVPPPPSSPQLAPSTAFRDSPPTMLASVQY